MKILYDYQAFAMQTYGGVSRCFVELYKHLPKKIEAQISLRESNNRYVQCIENVKPAGYGYKHFICKNDFYGKEHLHLWTDILRKIKYYPNYNQNYTIELLKEGNFDIFHPTYFDDYFLPYLNEKPFVLTIHDMIPELFDGLDNWQKEKKKILAKQASHIIAVSQNTKNDIMDILHIPEDKISVIYHAAPDTASFIDNSFFSFPYILYVGSRTCYKNFRLMLSQLRNFLLSHDEVKLVCTGTPFTESEILYITELGLKDSIIHFFAEESELGNLYHHALCFLYPSAYEGFGIPILEAYKEGCPVLLNRASCFPEIAGEGAFYFELNKERSNLNTVIERFWSLSHDELLQLKQRQKERLKLFSWSESAKALTRVYEEVISRYGA